MGKQSLFIYRRGKETFLLSGTIRPPLGRTQHPLPSQSTGSYGSFLKGKMFRATMCPSSDQTASHTEWKIPVSHGYSKFSWWWAHSCPKHVQNILRSSVHLVGFIWKRLYKDSWSKKHKKLPLTSIYCGVKERVACQFYFQYVAQVQFYHYLLKMYRHN